MKSKTEKLKLLFNFKRLRFQIEDRVGNSYYRSLQANFSVVKFNDNSFFR